MSTDITDTPLMDELRALLAETFRVDLTEISADAQLGELPQWDSMAHMDLMLALEARYGVQITAETIGGLTSLTLILAYVEGLPNGG
ncbi:MAG: acyl carrier protein [Anaerolineales bacterium]|nr:acyl carrier protein [Anaerolineales bacterium]